MGEEREIHCDSEVQESAATKSGDVNTTSESVHSHRLGLSFHADSHNHLKRRLNNRQIQLFAIGATIGSAVFITPGTPLTQGGPGNLLLGYLLQCCVMAMVVNCEAEQVSFMPITAALTQLPAKWVDEAFGFMVGWNYFLWVGLTIPFELVATSLIMDFWRDDIPVAAVVCALIVFYT